MHKQTMFIVFVGGGVGSHDNNSSIQTDMNTAIQHVHQQVQTNQYVPNPGLR